MKYFEKKIQKLQIVRLEKEIQQIEVDIEYRKTELLFLKQDLKKSKNEN